MPPFDRENEQDEIAKIYAMQDLENENWEKALSEANAFYKDFSSLSSPDDIALTIKSLIRKGVLTLDGVHNLIENLITVFEKTEEYEKCGHLLKIKKCL